MAAQVQPGEPDAAHAAHPTRATVQAQSSESELHPHIVPSEATPATDAAIAESRDSRTSGTTPSPAAGPSPAPSGPGLRRKTCTQSLTTTRQGRIPRPAPCSPGQRSYAPQPTRPPHMGNHLDLDKLRRAYDIYHRKPSHNLVDALQTHFQGVRSDRGFAAALLSHGATNICVRQLQALLTLGQHTPDDLINVWIWWFNYHQPDRARIWVPHLAWAYTLVAPPNEPGPGLKPGGRMRPAPKTERRRPQHSTVQGPRVLGKQDGQEEEAKPPDDDGALRTKGGAGGTRGASAARHPQHRRHGGVGERPLLPGEDHAMTTGKPLGLGGC